MKDMMNVMNETMLNDIMRTAENMGTSIEEAIYYTVPTEDYRNFGDIEVGLQPVHRWTGDRLKLVGVHVLHYFIDEDDYEKCYTGDILYFPNVDEINDPNDPGTVLICEDTNPTALPELPF